MAVAVNRAERGTYWIVKEGGNGQLAKEILLEIWRDCRKKEQKFLDNKELEQEQKLLQKKIDEMADSKEKLESNVRIYDEDLKWQLQEPGIVQSAKSYKERLSQVLKENSDLKGCEVDMGRLKVHMGAEKVQAIIDSVRESERVIEIQKKSQHKKS